MAARLSCRNSCLIGFDKECFSSFYPMDIGFYLSLAVSSKLLLLTSGYSYTAHK